MNQDIEPSDQEELPVKIDKSSIQELPRIQFQGEVIIVNRADAVKQAVDALSQHEVLGFDTETKPAFRKGQNFLPSLLQLASADTAYLFQLSALDSLDELLPLLTAAEILKVGIAIHDDLKALKKVTAFEPKGFVEISKLTKELNILNTGLRPLTALFLGGRLSKKAQLSNWSMPRLTPGQIQYAATDAWVSREIYMQLDKWAEKKHS